MDSETGNGRIQRIIKRNNLSNILKYDRYQAESRRDSQGIIEVKTKNEQNYAHFSSETLWPKKDGFPIPNNGL